MTQFRSIRDIELAGRRVLIRVDFNLPLDGDSHITSDRRMRAALPTIEYCLSNNAQLVLMSHLGRAAGKPDARFSLHPVADRLQEMLQQSHADVRVRLADAIAGWSPDDQQPGEVVLLENLRFDSGEKGNEEAFARNLRRFGEIYVNDAFANCHRKHASMFAVPKQFDEADRVIGLLVERELRELDDLFDDPRSPLVAVLGGVKVADKLGVVESLLSIADTVLIGGAMAYTFMKACGQHVGSSLVEDDQLDDARRLLDQAGDALMLPLDHTIAEQPNAAAKIESAIGGIAPDWYGMDIGPATINDYREAIASAATVIWNGPMGKFEDEPFRYGTEAVARATAASDAQTFVGGGETGQVVEQFGLTEQIDHVSTGGGAFLKYVQDRELPALSVISRKAPEHAG